MNLREKVGALFVCGFDGHEPNEAIQELIQGYHIGGVIYFRRNVKSVKQMRRMSEKLQQLSAKPLFLAIDQEGGMVARIDEGVALMPGAMTIGAVQDEALSRKAAEVAARELRAMDINMNFAPSLDVNNNPMNPVIGIRSYGEDPELVSRMGVAAIAGYEDGGVIATAKHFPGHGDTDTDSHYAVPLVPHDKERLHAVELAPFKAAISAGVDVIMTAHVIFPAYEERGIPATMSDRILTGLLRDELDFQGVIVTDCLEMSAISKGVGVAAGAVKAVQAGADLVLVSHTLELQREAIDAVVKAVEAGEISEARIDESVARIVALKEKYRLDEAAAFEEIGSEAHWETMRAISERSITLVKGEAGALPLDVKQPVFTVWPEVRVGTEVDEVIPQAMTMGKALSAYAAKVQEEVIGLQPTDEEIQRVLEGSRGCTQIVVGTYNADVSPGQQHIVRALLEREGTRVIVAALRSPYDLRHFPEVGTYIACYENRPLAMESLAKVLTGQLAPLGKLPVTL